MLTTRVPLSVDYDLSIEAAQEILVGPPPKDRKDSRCIDPYITSENFPTTHCGKADFEVVIYDPQCRVHTGTMLRLFDKDNRRGLSMQELLAYGIRYLEKTMGVRPLDTKPVAGLGSFWKGPDKRCYAACLYGDSSVKRIHLDYCESPWSSGYLFPTVPGRDPRLPSLLAEYAWLRV